MLKESMRLDLRRRRADVLVNRAMQVIDRYLSDEDGARREAHYALLELFHAEGIEVLSDFDRANLGLSPRGPDGWTAEEILALEKQRLDALLRPISMVIPAPASKG